MKTATANAAKYARVQEIVRAGDNVSLLTTCRLFDFIDLLLYCGHMRNSFPAADASACPAPEPSGTSSDASEAGADAEKREHLRFDKVFPVRVESILFGNSACVARNVSAGGIFLETRDPLPLGSRIRVCFLTPDESAEIVAFGEVKNHYFLNFHQGGLQKAVSGMAVRFLGFEEEGANVLHDCLDRFRVVH